MTPEEAEMFDTNEDLFLHLIKKGFREKEIKNSGQYISRLKEEIQVLKDGDVIDYFLVLYDIVMFAKRNDILVGIGRGSAGGSLVSYLLGIIQIDPLEFDLLFARFLNPGRMGSFEDCEAYELLINNSDTDEDEKITFNEGSLIRVAQDADSKPIFIEDLTPQSYITRPVEGFVKSIKKVKKN